MTDDPQKPRVRKRVETALKEKDSATRMRRWADELSEADPTGARWTRKDADAIEAKAEIALSRSSYTTGLPETGNGGELVPLPESQTFAIAEAVRDPPDMLAHSASTQRMELAAETDVLSLGSGCGKLHQGAGFNRADVGAPDGRRPQSSNAFSGQGGPPSFKGE